MLVVKYSPKYQNILKDITTNILLNSDDIKGLKKFLEDKFNENADMSEIKNIKESLKKFYVIDEEVPFSSKERGKNLRIQVLINHIIVMLF